MAPTKEKVSNNFPDDIAFDILSRLPLKSVKRFNCVRKSWADLFESPQFMSMYRGKFISKRDNDNSHVLLKPSLLRRGFYNTLFSLSGKTFKNKVKLDWPPPFRGDANPIIYILDSDVNGTLCLYQAIPRAPASEMRLKVAFWNPTTKEVKVIPPGSVDCLHDKHFDVHLIGFGYDPVTHDYKLIRNLTFHQNKILWQIYSLRSNSWRNLDIEMPQKCPLTEAYYLNGACHWRGFESVGEVLVSFNFIGEVFHITPLDIDRIYRVLHRRLVVLKESIAIITMHKEADGFDISILGEVGVKESWIKLFSIGPVSCVDYPVGVGKKSDIFFTKKNEELARFDLSSQMIEDIGVKGDPRSRIVIYKESLLPIGGINS